MKCYSDCGCAGAVDADACVFDPPCARCDFDSSPLDLGTCQQCGTYSTARYCYATDACKEAGGADVL